MHKGWKAAGLVAAALAAALVGFTLLLPRAADAQTLTKFWNLTGTDGAVLRQSSTQNYCEEWARTEAPKLPQYAQTDPITLQCVPMLSVKKADTPVPPDPPKPPQGQWVEGKSSAAEPKVARPAKGVATPDPTFGNVVYRVSDRSEPPSGFARNDYSRRQAFNADNTLQLVYARDGFWHVYDANTLKYVKRLNGPAGDAEPQWHPTNPKLLRYLPTNGVGMKVLELDVAANTSRQVADLGPRLKARWSSAAAAWTKSEGSPSADGRFWCFMVDTSNWSSVGVVTWDMQTDTILGYFDTKGERPDHVSMSPSGRYCVVSGDGPRGTVAYAPDFRSSRKLLAKSEHSDLGLLASGADVYVSVDYQSNAGDVFMIDLETGTRTVLFPSYLNGSARAFHFSGKAFALPGWVLVGSYGEYGGKGPEWMDRKLVLVELKAGGRLLNVAWHHANAPSYFFEPHGSISRDGTRAAFTSAWGGTADTDISAYQIRLFPVP